MADMYKQKNHVNPSRKAAKKKNQVSFCIVDIVVEVIRCTGIVD